MDPNHYRSLRTLSLFCHFCGLFPTFFGILVVFMDVVRGDFAHIQVGLFMFITGYTQVKISERIDVILSAERQKDDDDYQKSMIDIDPKR